MSKKPMRTPSVIGLAALAAALTATASCGDVVRSNDSPVILSVRQMAVLTANCCSVAAAGTEVGTATLSVDMKNRTDLTAPTPNNRVTITRYHINYSRADGRSAPGIDVPYPFDGVMTASIDANNAGPVTFDLVRQVAKKEMPLTLITGSNVVSTITEVTFFGHDLVGNDVSASGSVLINFRP